ncbi:MAG: efflux RND transporter periplasmic adaptor subunit [Helicobacteraceae bacterium]|jgi:HlyD family secretion protein|nr:efflux RND transporter periplasmic adaptor subunit [Helicobacteraceae bacterium]
MEEMQKVTEYKSSGLKWKIGIAVFVLLLGAGTYLLFFQQETKEGYTYITEPLKKGDLTISVSATGYIEPVENVEVGTEVSGMIEKVYADYNDLVKKGQILAQLDKTKYQSTLNKAEASLAGAKATLANMEAQLYQADATVARNKTLRESTKNRLPSRSDWDRDWANYLVAKAQVANAKAQVDQARHGLVSSKYDLERTTIYSLIDGIILTRNIDPGQTVAASFQTPVLFKIAKDLTKMELQASIDEADIAKVKTGQTAMFSVDAYPEREFEARIKLVRVNSEIVDGVVTYKAVMEVDNQELLLKPGMTADADIITETLSDTFVVPRAALLYIPIEPRKGGMFGSGDKEKITIDPKQHVWVLKNGEPKKSYVKVLGNSGSNTALSSDALKEGDPLIVTQEKRQ